MDNMTQAEIANTLAIRLLKTEIAHLRRKLDRLSYLWIPRSWRDDVARDLAIRENWLTILQGREPRLGNRRVA